MDSQAVEERQQEERRETIASEWYGAIAGTCYPVSSTGQVREELGVLAGKAIDFVAGAPPGGPVGEEIGRTLARLHYIQAEALGETLRVLGERLQGGPPEEGADECRARLATLLAGIATGFFREACRIVLTEQETIRAALVTEIERSRGALKVAHDELEQRVRERTAELARANEELRAEVAERQRVEEALRESEQKYRSLVEDMNDVVYVVDRQGEVTYVSPSIQRMLGYSSAEVMGHKFGEFVHPEDLLRIQEGFQKLLAGQSRAEDYRLVTKSGETRCVRTSSSPVWEDSRVVGLQGLLADVTESRQAKDALQASEERWRMLVENAPVLVATTGPDLGIQFINWVPEQGISEAEVVGADVLRFAAPSHWDVATATIRRVFETGESEYMQLPVVSSRRSDAWYRIYVGPLWRGDRVAEVMLVAVDVTEERRLAEMKDNLIRDVSHELRTPLAKVQMSLDWLVQMLQEEEIDRERLFRISGFATSSTERMLRTVENILDLTRLEAGAWPNEQQAIRPELLIHEAITYALPLSSAKGLDLGADLPELLPEIRGDWDKLYRVLRNLIYNAIKFTEEGQVIVTAEDRGEELAIAVRDQGQGILPENLDRIFQRFFQEKARHLGAGLGLAICKAIVEEHGGRIWAESAGRGQGATFWFTVPVETGEEEEA